jgi:hypothetical protein
MSAAAGARRHANSLVNEVNEVNAPEGSPTS